MGKKKYFFIIVLFIVVGIILFFSLKKDEIVNNNKKTIYYVTLKGKGFDINQTLSCFTYSNKCKVKLPLINRTNYELVGWSKSDLINPEYLVNESIEIDNNIELYAITRKKLTLLAGEEEISCYIYNEELSCKVKLPSIENITYYDNKGNKYNPNDELTLFENMELSRGLSSKKTLTLIDKETKVLSCEKLYNKECEIELPYIEGVIGWNTSKNNSNIEYKNNAKIKMNKDLVLYGIRENKVTLKIYGKESLSCNLYNNEYCNIKLPYYDNVIGYSLNNNESINYNKGSIIKLTKNTTIYPIYENKVEHTITINGNGASVQSNSLSCKGDNCNITLPIITRNGYEIIGYNLKANDKTALYKSGQTINVNSNMVLYAITKKEIVVNLESVGSRTCNIYNNQSICSVYIPIIDGINGWSIVKNSDYIFYEGGKSYSFSRKIDLYPVKSKKINANFIVNGNIYTTKSCTLNNSGCYIEAPIINIKGTTIYEYSTSINGETKCLAGSKCYIEENTNFYVHKGSYYRELDVYDSIIIGKTTIEVQKGCSYSNNIRDVKEAYNYFPKLFTNVKLTFLTNNDYVKRYGNATVGKNTTIETNDYAITFIDINCETYTNYDYPSEVIVHELVHTYDRNTYFNQNKIALSSTSVVSNLYNKYVSMSNRPMRDYSYSNKQEFMADMGEYYFLKYNKNQNIDIPNDIKEFVEKYLKG